MSKDHTKNSQVDKTSCKVLVCDDSKLVRITARKILTEQFDLILAEDGEQGWEKICADDQIQVVFTDLGMPKLDGFGLIERVRSSQDERIRGLPMIVITGAAEDENVKRKAFELGATDFVSKPFKATAILARADAHTKYRQVTNVLQENANLDALTGVLNHKGFNEQLEKDISFVNRHAENLAIMMIELDNYDELYRKIGQKTSDNILKAVASTLLQSMRKEDSVARQGVAKFVGILPLAKAEGVVKLSRRISKQIEAFKLTVGGERVILTSSIGVSTLTKGCMATAKDIIACAENALSNAKSIGSGEIQFLKLEPQEHEHTAEIHQNIEVESIDILLDKIAKGQSDAVLNQLDTVIHKLRPILDLLNAQQRENLFR